MPLRFLVGPLSADWASSPLDSFRQQGLCRTFGSAEVDLPQHEITTWKEVSERLEDWQPEVVLLVASREAWPLWIYSCPLPVVILVQEVQQHLQVLRLGSAIAQRVLADPSATPVLQRLGISLHPSGWQGLDGEWQQILEDLQADLPILQEQAATRKPLPRGDQLLVRLWQVLSGAHDRHLRADLLQALDQPTAEERAAEHRHELVIALAILVEQQVQPEDLPLLARLDRLLEQVQQQRPSDRLLGAHRVALALALRQPQLAVQRARTLLRGSLRPLLEADLERLPPPSLGMDLLRQQWDQAAWAPPAEGERASKVQLLTWWLHTVLAQVGNEQSLADAYEAVQLRPDLPTSRALLGAQLAAVGRTELAVRHLQQAVQSNPLDQNAVALLRRCYLQLGDRQGLAELAERLPEEPQVEPLLREGQASQPLVSIIILCCNARAMTEGCLESLLAGTRSPYELILVDNGSTDDTLTYLKSLPGRVGPRRWVILRNESNRGFAAGCNQGLRAAVGEQICFLNNDTLLPEGWLEGLQTGFASFGPGEVGMVGPLSNYTLPTQTVTPGYQNLLDYPAFAQAWQRDRAKQFREVEVLSGFCLLARRDVLQRLEGFDERFGLGTFEDNDLSLRVRQAGYRLVVVDGVYIHHHGSQTFRALKLDPAAQQARNQVVFEQKWRPQQPARAIPTAPQSGPLSLPFQVPVTTGTHPATMQRVSLCLIVKNEEANLRACIEPVRHLFYEIVVIDTGSTDGTVALARSLGARVIEHPWQDSFAHARNQSIEAATGDWIFWLDADDRVDADNQQRLKECFAGLGTTPLGFSMKCWCVPSQPGELGTVVDHVRLFPRLPQVRWEHRVHEQILLSLRRLGAEVRSVPITIQHIGYQDLALRGRKLQRDLRLLELDLAEHPGHPFVLFNLGSVLLEMGHFREALIHLENALKGSQIGDSITRKLYALIAQGQRQSRQLDLAERTLREGLVHFSEDAELLFLLGLLLRERGDRPGSIVTLRRLLAGRDTAQFGSVDAGLRGYKGKQNLAVVLLEENRLGEAEPLLREVTTEQPRFVEGWLALVEVLVRSGRAGEAETVLQQALLAAPDNATLVARLQALRRGRP